MHVSPEFPPEFLPAGRLRGAGIDPAEAAYAASGAIFLGGLAFGARRALDLTRDIRYALGLGGRHWEPHAGFQMPAADRGRFVGSRGHSAFALSDDAAASMGLPLGTAILWRQGIPDFARFAVAGPKGLPGTFRVAGLNGEHGADRRLMLQYMAGQTDMSQRDVERWLRQNDVRLHHAGGNSVQIVPTRIHALHHSGGAQSIRQGN